ncbi:MAG: molecular chaperone DnaK, partial [Myxococcales bacterium]|nr:molecular chaperone DnaK [Myxococcales bacterium]
AVGGHLMLGGDNMDAALAHHIQEQAELESLDATEWSALVQAARRAKETLLGVDAPREAVVSIQRRGSRLLGNTRSVTLTRGDVRAVLLDGFLPRTRATEVASRKGRAGLTTLGLPYTTDPAIPRHICAFLRNHVFAAREAGARVEDGLPRPDRVLLNGGVFNAPAIVSRLQDVLKGWYGEPVPLLRHTSLDTAVARGAARFALGKRGFGPLIAGGSARAYYIGVDQRRSDARKAFCVAPRGMDEGSTARVDDPVFSLVVGRMVQFPIYSYTGDRVDTVGALIELPDDPDAQGELLEELDPLPPLETSLAARADLHVAEDGTVPVRLSATLTESGTLEIYLVTVELPPRQWKLEFALSEHAETSWSSGGEPEDVREPLPTHFPEARARLEQVFGDDRLGGDARAGKRLRKDLEKHLGPRGEWSSSLCRALVEILLAREEHRARTPDHELGWLRLVGWCMRPGFGARGDARRIDALWRLFERGDGVVHTGDKTIGAEWWVLWRRVAGGLSRDRQGALFEVVRPWLAGGRPPPGPRAHGKPEMLRMLAALEQLPAARKQEAGAWFLQSHKKVGSWWPLGRLGARQPFRGRVDDVVPPAVAESWLERVLELDWSSIEGAAFAAVLLARMTGDPARDIQPGLRKQVLRRLQREKSPSRWIGVVSEKSSLSERDTRQLFGDSLPTGLRLT